MAVPKIHLCNEVLRALPFAAQCRTARALGYDGLEIAPFTLAEDPSRLSDADLRRLRAMAEGEGLEIAGLHWLMSAPAGLSITASDPQVVARTHAFGRRLIAQCAALGGRYLVHGSPAQRRIEGAGSRDRARAYFAAMAEQAAAHGCLYLIEPLSAQTAETITSVEEALALVAEIDHPALATMIDCYAAALDGLDLPGLLRAHLPSGKIRHIHLNDDNAGAPGQGGLDFGAILGALAEAGYRDALGIEPFTYLPDPQLCAEQGIRHIREVIDGLTPPFSRSL